MEKNYRAELVGCFGDPIDENPTGVMEEAAFAHCGLNWRYLSLLVKDGDLKQALEGAKAMSFRGFNLTMPHKRKILPMLDGVTEAARIIGAVNTVMNIDGSWIGDNTDGKGFVETMRNHGENVKDKHIAILGAGGAARAIAVECGLAGAAKITVMNRSEEHGRELADLVQKETRAAGVYLPWNPGDSIPADTNIVIQATCVGLKPKEDEKPDINYDSIDSHMVVCDVVFNPVDSLFLQEARKRGAKTVSGIGMLVQQGALNFALWTGLEPPVDVMYKTLEHEFEE